MSSPEPWANQLAAASWLAQRQYGFLAHEVGTGKSRSLLMAYAACLLMLIVCPIAVGPAWAKQIGLFDRRRKAVIAVSGSATSRARAIREAVEAGGPVAVVVNYDSVWRGEVGKTIASAKWDAIVLDESHRIKSPNGRCSKWLAKLAQSQPQAKRACLSGTPTPQSPLDWWSQLRFLDESLVHRSFNEFRSRIAITHPRFRGWVTGFRPAALADLRRHVDPVVHRVTAAEVLTLPPAIHTVIPVEVSRATAEFYRSLEDEMVAAVQEGVVTAANRMVVVGRLQAATSGFTRVDASDTFTLIDGDPAKRLAIREFLEDFPLREPLVVFTRFIEDINQVIAEVKASGRSVSELSGRAKHLERWQAGETDVLVVQQQAGGAGVDLTRACYCIYYSLSHSLGDYEQSLGRLHRHGQTRPVRYYHLVCRGSVDETIYQSLAEKRDVVESILARLTKRTEVAA